MVDIWTRAVLVGAAFLFAAYLALANARRIARASDWLTHVPRPRLAAFLAFAIVAMIHAQKSGTNAPLRGASVELRAESGKWEVESDGAVAAGDSIILHSTLYRSFIHYTIKLLSY